ncbi:MAG: alpha-2-macroglobulin [Hyphomicrobium sp.]|nr:alpha-2-macroglobulin [Hyphomicrobium sp.]
MRLLSALLFLLTACLVSPFLAESSRAETEPKFRHDGLVDDAKRYETYIMETWKRGPKPAAELRRVAEKAMTTDPRAASRDYATAVATEPKNADSWLGLARALLAIKPDENQGSERYDLPVNASGAAFRAYELSPDRPARARALAVLGEAMERRAYWRPAIEALRTSLALADAPDVRQRFEKLRTEHGFRMTDYKTDTEGASPRVCAVFSENLSRGQIEFSKFVTVDGKDPQSVVAEGAQLCVENLAFGQRYEIQIREGLPSDIGETLEKKAVVAVYVPDRKASVRFSGKAYVLPSRGQQGIPVVSVNTTRLAIEVYRVGDRSISAVIGNGEMERQLYSYDVETLRDRTGVKVYEGEMDVASDLNAEVTTAFPVTETLGTLEPGVYAMVAEPADKGDGDNYGQVATQWFVVSDLGLTAFTGKDGVHAFVRSLADTSAVEGASVKLVARNNEVLATLKTDAKGYVRFDSGLAKGEGGLQPAILVAEKDATEYAFLDLTQNAFDLSDRGVKGREAPGPIDAYVYTERGVYRPGEEVNVTALVRDAAGVAMNVPSTLIVTRPDGVEHARYPLADEGLGGRSLRMLLSGGAMTGTWRASLHADPKAPALSQVSFLVEDYVPERLDLALDAGSAKLAPGQSAEIAVQGRYLYGPPAAGLTIEGEVIVKAAATEPAELKGFQFGDAEQTITTVRQPLEGLPVTDNDGKAKIAIALPAIEATARPLEAQVIVRLREVSGRTIERSVSVPVDLGQARIGVKPLFGPTGPGENAKAGFEVVSLGADGKQVAETGLVWELVRLDTSWQWYSRDGYWTYEAQTLKRRIANGTVDALADKPVSIAADVDYGRYKLEVRSVAANGPQTNVLFSAGWYTSADAAESPEMLDVALDKESYKAGDVAKLRIATRTGGRALIAILGNGLVSTEEVEVAKGGGEVSIPVGADWGPGAYATALLYRPMNEAEKRMPSRAIGVKWIGVDQSARTLSVDIGAPDKIKARDGLAVPVKIGGLTPGEEAYLTVAAVDVGILNLTRFEAPAPTKHFYQQRKLALDIRDYYGRLIDGMRAEKGKMRSGGDGMDEEGMKGSPPVEETVAEFSGLVKVGADGSAKVEFALPDFNGTVRVMAVAWSKDKLGQATKDILVRDAVALTVSAPRFLTLGDEVTIDFSVHNVDGAAGEYRVALSKLPVDASAGGAQSVMDRPVPLKAGERVSERIALRPKDVGSEVYDVAVTGPDGIDVRRRLTFDVEPPAGDIKRTTVSALKGGGGTLTLGKDLISGLIKSRTRVNVSVGPAARLDVPGLLTALDRYPYGCAEQTVSRAMPLVYVNAVAEQIGIAPDKEIRARVEGAITRLYEMQDQTGAFGIWGPADTDLWLTSYVADFLTRAKEAGYPVRPLNLSQALDRLQNFVANAQDSEKSGESRAYALYVLSRNGRAPMGELRYFADEKLDQFATPLAKAQLGAALSMTGDKNRAERVFRAAIGAMEEVPATLLARDDYGSNLRDGAALVTLVKETGLFPEEAPRLVNVVAKAYESRQYTSTQEQAWMLLAAHALGDDLKGAKLAIDGASVEGSIVRGLSAQEVEKGVVISNTSDAAVDAVVTVIGASLSPEPGISKGFRITRSYFTLDGTPVEVPSAAGGRGEMQQNTRLVAVVKVESDEAHGQVLLVDRLPSGLEIDNPRLVEGGDISSLEWLKSVVKPTHTEFRDDRFVAAFDLATATSASNAVSTESTASEGEGEGEAEAEAATPDAGTPETAPVEKPAAASAAVAYVVRAVSQGSFVHPAATVEDMYRPERYARTAAGTLTVRGRE